MWKSVGYTEGVVVAEDGELLAALEDAAEAEVLLEEAARGRAERSCGRAPHEPRWPSHGERGRMRPVAIAGAAAMAGAVACASAPRGARAPTALTSVDTVFYEVAGNTPAEWRQQLPRAAAAAGIRNGGVTYTMAQMLVEPGYTRTTPTGCQFERSLLQLRSDT